MYDYYGIIFKSIGIKQNILTGILSELERHDLIDISNIKYFGGINTGSIIATLCAADYSLIEIKEKLKEFYSEKGKVFFKKSFACGLIKNSNNNQINKYGNFVESLLYKKFEMQNMMFKDLYNKTRKHLKLAGFNLTNKTIIHMDHVNTPNMLISDAVCISVCDTSNFKPFVYNKQLYIDTSSINYAPYYLFNKLEQYNILYIDVQNDYTEENHVICEANLSLNNIINSIQSLSISNETNIPRNITTCTIKDSSNSNFWSCKLTEKELSYFYNIGKYYISIFIEKRFYNEGDSPTKSPNRLKRQTHNSLDLPRQRNHNNVYKEKVLWYLNSLSESLEEKKLTNTVE